ncbi:MAG: hypothetical protein CL935_03530, partial [Deltaproteobacteria bacterium]|nr:hypothetical protein [Deltaproteobacteria bacterium]
FKKFIASISVLFLLLNFHSVSISQSSEFKQSQMEILPLTSFLFANRDTMRAGWYISPASKNKKNLKSVTKKPEGSLFVQLKPRFNEGEYQLALRVLRGGSHQRTHLREFTGGKPLNHKVYITIPFDFLIGVIQGEAIRSLFPNDRVEAGGWLHQVTYDWETPELIEKVFTNSENYIYPNSIFKQGINFTIPWKSLRSDLELEPLAVRDPLFIRRDDSGLRYAFYRIKHGDTLYSSVIIRFIGEKTHYARSQNASDLLILNGLADARSLSPGQYIKIPLEWIRSEYLHHVPSIYRLTEEKNFKKNIKPKKHKPYNILQNESGKNYKIDTISQR